MVVSKTTAQVILKFQSNNRIITVEQSEKKTTGGFKQLWNHIICLRAQFDTKTKHTCKITDLMYRLNS